MNHSNILHINSNAHFRKPEVNNNFIIHSKLNTFERYDSSSPLSVKLVLKGKERYRLNNKRYDLSAGEFLIVDQDQELDISFNENNIAEGMCFYFNRKYVDQLSSLLTHGDSWGLDNYGADENEYSLLSTKFKVNESEFGQYLEKTARTILHHDASFISEDCFIDMADQLVQQQKNEFTKVNRLSSLKMSTRIELYSRAIAARHYIEDNITNVIHIEKLTTVASLSEVQLHRVFKQIFNITPYQYILTAKLNRAVQLIRAGKHSISEISHSLGFADLPTFSKAFKRKFGVTPTAFQ